MELHSSSLQLNQSKVDANVKSCHQCRQKPKDFSVACKNSRNGKPCLITFCSKCLLKRYGEKAEEVNLINDWMCPKCKGICECSACMKKRGQQPTGLLVHTAKASGSNSVSELLSKKTTLKRVVVLALPAVRSKENGLGGINTLKVGHAKTKKVRRENLKEISNGSSIDDACQNKKSKKRKLYSGVLDGEVKRNANDEMETKVEENHGDANIAGAESQINPTVLLAPKIKKSKKPKLYSGDLDGEVKRNANDEMETKVEENHGDANIAGAESQTNPTVLCAPKIKKQIPLPTGTEMTKILDNEFAPEDVGNALQFLEFCRVFGKVIDVQKGEAATLLRSLINTKNMRRLRGQTSSVVEFQIELLSLISDSDIESSSLTVSNGKNSWLKVLKDLITKSDTALKDFPLDWLNKGITGYYDLDFSRKLILLNFICDEALGTMKLRSYIDDRNTIFAEKKKAAKSKVAEAKEKERSLKQKLQDEMAKAVVSNGDSLSIAKDDALLANIKSEAAKAHTELLEAKGPIRNRKWCDAVRIAPKYLDKSGKAFWKLRSCTDKHAFLLQDIKIEDGDSVEVDEKWFVYGAEQEDEVNEYIYSKLSKAMKSKLRSKLRSKPTSV